MTRWYRRRNSSSRQSFTSQGRVQAQAQEEEITMTKLKTATLAAALLAGATSLTMAQNAPGGGNNGMPPNEYKGPGAYQSYKAEDFQFRQGNTGANAAASGGSGTHTTSQKTGSAENTQKVLRNQNGYRTGSYRIYSSANCHLVHSPGSGRLVRICR
jgi:hypothetical protein